MQRGVQFGEGNTQHNIETYIHSQIIHTQGGPESETIPKPVASPPRGPFKGRLRAAAYVMQMDPQRGLAAYQEIAYDSNAPADIRLEAAAYVRQMDPQRGLATYQEIAYDSKAPAKIRLQAAAYVRQMDEKKGLAAYNEIAYDCSQAYGRLRLTIVSVWSLPKFGMRNHARHPAHVGDVSTIEMTFSLSLSLDSLAERRISGLAADYYGHFPAIMTPQDDRHDECRDAYQKSCDP